MLWAGHLMDTKIHTQPDAWQAVDEASVQHLREAVWLSRQQAVDSLRHTRGDLAAALRQELAAFGMETAMLRRLALEYAVYR